MIVIMWKCDKDECPLAVEAAFDRMRDIVKPVGWMDWNGRQLCWEHAKEEIDGEIADTAAVAH